MKKLSIPFLKSFLTLCLVIFATACAVPSVVIKINTSADQQAQFAQYRTYNWYEAAPTGAAINPDAPYANLKARLKRAIEQEIQQQGLQKDTANPQVLLAFDVSLPKPGRAVLRQYPDGTAYGLAAVTGYRYDYSHNNIQDYKPVNAYRPGTLMIDVVDAGSRELVWRGWAEEVVEDFNADLKTVKRYVDDIIDKFPSYKTPAP